jgi:hypothetical protein
MGLSNFFSSGGSKSSSLSTSYLPEQAAGLKEALALYLEQLGQNAVYPGTRVAPLTGTQQGVLGQAPNFLSSFGTPTTAQTPLFGETGAALKGILAGQGGAQPITPQQTQDYFQNAIYNPTMRTMQQDIMPAIDEGYTGGNFFGTGRGKARQKAATDIANTLTEQRAGLEWDVLGRNQDIANQQANRTLQAIPQGMQYAAQPAQQTLTNVQTAINQLGGMQQLFGVGGYGQEQQQREIESEIAKFAEQNNITDPTNLAVILSLLGMNFQTTTQKSETKGQGIGYAGASNFFGTLGKAAGSLATGGTWNIS